MVTRIVMTLVVASVATAAPNVLFVIADDLQACLGSYGHSQVQTPHLDALAARGVRFERAHCQLPLCGPSRASLMAGLRPTTTKITGNTHVSGSFRAVNSQLKNHPSMSGFLRENGYFAARVSKIYHMGVPGGIERGDPGGDDPDSWDYAYNVMGPETLSPGERLLLSPGNRHYGGSFAATIVPDDLADTQADAMAVTQAIAILESRAKPVIKGARNKVKQKPQEPFFLAVGLVRPHVPLVAPKRCWDLYPEPQLPTVPPDDLADVPRGAANNVGGFGMSVANQQRALAGYFASVTYLDEQFGRLMAALDRLDLRDDTIVIFCSDHGYNLGEHGCWQKMGLWRETTRVPLIISAPGFAASAGKSCAAMVELIDLYPTIADLCGMTDKAPTILEGKSLRPFLEEPATVGDFAAYTICRRGRSLRTNNWRYTDWGGAGEELYDASKDPGEFTNLAKDPEYAGILKQLRERLATRQ